MPNRGGSFNASVTGASATALLAINDTFGEAERIGDLSAQHLLGLIVVVSWVIVIYQNRNREKDRAAERAAATKAFADLLAHHNGAVITMNAEREEFRKGMTEMVENNTRAMTQLTDAVQNLRP